MGSDPAIDVYLTAEHTARALRTDVLAGLSGARKSVPPKWLYDSYGSELFERITELPEYYPTRAEREILQERSGQIASLTGARTLVELGSGSSEKTRLLLEALRSHGCLEEFVPFDVSESALREAAAAIMRDYPGVGVHGVVGDFTEHLALLPAAPARMIAFLGGTVGNLYPDERAKFLRSVRETLRVGEWLLLGTDLVKAPATLRRAYDDADGVTAEFNRNVLRVLNRELDGDFDVAAFSHVAWWNDEHEWVEMRLRANRAMRVALAKLDLRVELAEGEDILTEISSKFRRHRVAAELSDAGFEHAHWWTDSSERFALSLARAV